MTDYFTKYAEVYPVKNIQSSTVYKVLIDFISRHGIMRILYSDRGSNFISAAMQEVYELLGISKQKCLSYSPQGNGAFERLNKTLVNTLSHLVSFNPTDWCQQVPLALMAYRNAHHRSIDEKPLFLVNGRDLIMSADFIYAEPVRSYSDTLSYRQELIKRLHNAFFLVKSNLKKSAEEISKNGASLPKNNLIEVGDVVYLNTPKIKIHSSKKLSKLIERKCAKVHLNRIFKVPERAIFEWESPSNAELEIPVDVSPTSFQRLPSEEEILKEFPPYTLPLETRNFLEEENYENQGNLVNLSGSREELSDTPEPVVEIQIVLIPSESNEHQVPSSEVVVEVQTCNSDHSTVIHDGSVSRDTEGNTRSENSWGNKLRSRDRSGFVKK
ncbi:reverse transcriptase [Caerostris extrusa]|uniref:Reverse transcriptase n=1 Tax=Caerostris extrusa TaxID=172846 RepID=A0AAV4VEK7_CAEEX|nr:reverse transcriptase [Caerostris extrusa]